MTNAPSSPAVRFVLTVLALVALLAAGARAAPPAGDTSETGELALDQVGTLVVEQTNALRREQGLDAVEADTTLTRAAARFARYMADRDRYGHAADGRTPARRAKAQGFRPCMVAENIAWERRSDGFGAEQLADSLNRGWANSPPHRHNMLMPQATLTGVAVAHSERSGRYYAVQMFGRPWSQRLTFKVSNEAGKRVFYRLDGRRQTLPPRAVRTHKVCAATSLTLPRDGRWQQVSAADGQRYVINAPATGPVPASTK